MRPLYTNRSDEAEYRFTVDSTPPAAPGINPVETTTHKVTQVITGTKEAYAAILLAGQEVVGHTTETTWQHTVSLDDVTNQFSFEAMDRAGNIGEEASVEILLDDIAPPPVDDLWVNRQGNGTYVTLNWAGYDESVHGDIANYRIYVQSSDFSDVSALSLHHTVNAGTFSYRVNNLIEGETYYFAVVAVDIKGNALTTVTAVAGSPQIVSFVSGHITQNTTWTLAGSPYIVTGDVVVRHSSARHINDTNSANRTTLTIEPGVEIRFDPGTGLYVSQYHRYSDWYHGALVAQGTEEAPIIFTSNAGTPSPGDWKGIYFRNATWNGTTVLEHCVVEYGGHTNGANIVSNAANPTIKNVMVRYSSAQGISLTNSFPTVSGNAIVNNNAHGISLDSASEPVISGNDISNNGSRPINNIHPDGVRKLTGNNYTGNGLNHIRVRSGAITSNSTWVDGGIPYILTGDVTVRFGSARHINDTNSANRTTLTIEPGVEIRFEPGTGLYVSQYHRYSDWYHGALVAQGTEGSPIIFTSSSTTPSPGDWKGIYFRNATWNGTTVLEHCVVEYGGNTNNGNIYLENAKPTIQYNTIRNSSHSGIYVNGTGANGVAIRCNNLKDNHYGVSVVNNAAPVIHDNNFLRNQNFGVNNSGSATVDARDNWWNDANGPGFNGDDVNGKVTVSSWLAAESECIDTPPTNTAPFVPKNPVPADGAVRVPVTAEGQPIAVNLNWSGGDPNPWDAVVYDVYFGTAADALELIAEAVETITFDKAGLEGGHTYYWKIVARDDAGAETAGAIWHFTTLGDPPDLIISDLTWQPAADLQAGQGIAFTATVENTGSGPAVDAFRVEFFVNGQSIGYQTINPVMPAGRSAQVSRSWTAVTGDHTVEARADSQEQVIEAFEENNTLAVSLPHVKDPTPPELTQTVPAANVSVKQAHAVSFTLADQYGVVDTAAVIASVAVADGGGSAVAGTVSEADNRYTFAPAAIPLADGTYTVSLIAKDLEGNTQGYNFSFTVDGQPPAEPAITGGVVLSGLIQIRPVENQSKTATIILTGSREDNTAVYINNQQKVARGSGNWSVSLSLAQGANALEVRLQDAAGNSSPVVAVDITVDSKAPAIGAMTPANGSFVNTTPAAITVAFTETGSGLNLEKSQLSVKDTNQQPVDGTWAVSGADQLVFTPAAALEDALYTVDLRLEDNFTNRSAAKHFSFTLDTKAPAAPVVSPVSSPTHKPTQTLSGTKEAYAALLLNGSQIVGYSAQTTWTYSAGLSAGDNSFTLAARDQAGNQSDPVTVGIFFDDVPPPAVNTLALDPEGDGRTIKLDWSGYNEAAHGDVSGYRIYRATTSFTSVSAAEQIDSTSAGNFKYTATDLTRNTPYWFAVTAVDARGNARTEVAPVSGSAKDIVPPGNVGSLKVQSFSDHLTFTWTQPADTHGDLAGYRLTFENEEPLEQAKELNSFTKAGLNSSTGYNFKVAAYDNDNNESSGIAITGVTLLENPAGLAAEVHSGYVDLSWDAVLPTNYVKHYAVYRSEGDFTDVAGLAPVLTSTEPSAKLAGLMNDTTYYIAVTAVNISDGEQTTVTTIAAVPEADSQGPEISNIRIDDDQLAEFGVLSRPVSISCEAQDPAGVSRVEFFIDGNLVRTDYNALYSCFWNVVETADGAHTLTIAAYDTLGNHTSEDYSLTVTLAAPEAPQITAPVGGTITNKKTITVSGQAEKYTEISLYSNGVETGVVVAVDAFGKFSSPHSLSEGENRLQAAAVNRAGMSPQSAEVVVTLDTTLPVSPTNLAAEAKSGGSVRLSWKAPSDTEVTGYNLYRASAPFTTQQGAGKINTNLIKTTSFNDLPPSDGTWYYRVSTVDAAANESDLSAEASAKADSTPPRASAIDYSPQGSFDQASGTMAPGTVNLILTVSEPLQSAPYLSIAPDGGLPISVQLSKDTDTSYSGFFVITERTPTGAAYAIFSARDAVGNRGTEIDSGRIIQIDTDGPTITRLAVSPLEPIQNDEQNPVTVTATIGLDEKVKAGELPQLSYQLSGDQRDPIDINTIFEAATGPGEAQTWQAEFELPADAGLNAAETFHLVYQGSDALDNSSDRITADNRFQVYQGELPPLAPPLEFKGQSRPGGKIRLSWLAVAEAVGYQIYRKAPGESELGAYARLDTVETFDDAPGSDGLYTYAIASIRQENTQEALSGLSDPVVVDSDSEAPGVPLNLALQLVANGIKVAWEPPPFTEGMTYSLYRAKTEITAVEGLAPLAAGIAQTLVVDPTPSLSDHWYAVTAVDAVGNESAPSNADYLNVQLLPVASITVTQVDTDPPLVSWTHPGGDIAGYDIYLGADATRVKLNTARLTQKSYTDKGYGTDERRYTIITVDNSDVESLGRSITMPVLQAVLSDGSRIERGIMNRLDYVVLNEGAGRVENIRLKVRVGSHAHSSESFDLDPGTSRTVPVVVGGYDDLKEGIAALTTTIEVTPRTKETVQIVRNATIEMTDGMLLLQIQNDEFTRAASGRVQFSIENTGEAEIEIVTAKNSGKSASDRVKFYLLDEDDNVLATQSFKQATGDKLVTLSNRNTVARIAAGERFTSEMISIPVPANAPDNVIIRLNIAYVYYHQGRTTQVRMNGLSTTHAITLVDTSYYGEVTVITPPNSTGDEDIVITGRAVERATDAPMGNVPLELVITLNGFERTYDVYTADDGVFTHRFKALPGESGIYRVRAVHPDRTDKPVHGQFVINKLNITPATLNLNAPKNYTNTIKIRVQTGDGTSVNNLRLEYAAEDQPGGEKPEGIHLTTGSPIAKLPGKKSATLPFTIWADNTAGATEKIKLTVKSDETDPAAWGTVSINARFSEAKPTLHFSPNHVETGVGRDKTVSENITLTNKGLADLYRMQISLLDSAKKPAPAWIYLTTARDQGDLAIGDYKKVGFAVSPTAEITEGNYSFYLRITAANHPTIDINLYVAVTLEGQGNALFKVSDIYTGGIDQQTGEIVQGLSNARVKLQNEAVLTEEYRRTTDSFGEAWFEGLPAGRYKCRISAKNHQEYIGRVWIKPGVTTTEDVFLDYNLVTVEWSVTEIAIEDKYEVVLNAVYETNVPAAVVVVEPTSVALPKMQAGDVFNGEFTLTNYGLVRADNLNFGLPPDDQNFRYEILGGLPDSLETKERITVAYRVTCLKSLEPDEDGQATGGGCSSYRKCARTSYEYDCANGVTAKGGTTYCWTRTYGTCGGSDGPVVTSGGGGSWNVGSGQGTGTVSKPAPQPKTIEGVKCFPEPPRKERFCLGCWVKDTFGNMFQDTGSSVNLVMREYYRDMVDLAVKVPGGMIEVKRWYYDNQWMWEHQRNKLTFKQNSLANGLESIAKGGVVYEKSAIDADIFIHDIFRIIKTETGYRWEDPKGGWIDYDDNGHVSSYGSRTGILAKLLYEDGQLTGVVDRNDTQVLWYETNGNGQIEAAYDAANRRVDYGYADGRLSRVEDVLDHETRFEYDGKGRLEKIIEPTGRTITVAYDKYNGVASVVSDSGQGFFFEYEFDEATQEQYARIETSAGKVKEIWYDRDFETRRVDINGRTVEKIDKDGRDLLVTDEQGNVTRKEYDEWDNLTRVVYPDGSFVATDYEHKLNRAIKRTDENGHVSEYEYDDFGNLIRKIEAVGTAYERQTEYTYDADGNLLTTKRLEDANTAEALTVMTYDLSGNLTSITDPEGGVIRFSSHDAMGNVLTKTDARGKEWSYEYDAAGRLASVTDPIVNNEEPYRNVTRLHYDEAGNKIRQVDPLGKETLYDYDENNNLTLLTDPAGNQTVFEYDANGKLLRQVDAKGKEIRYEYDLDGRLAKTIDGNGNEIAMEYDDNTGSGCSSCAGAGRAANQPSRITYPTFAKEFEYDKRGRKTVEKDVLSAAEIYLTDFDYDAAGNLIARTDKEEKTTAYDYDALNRLKTVTDPMTQDTAYFYDNRDNLTALTDAKGNTTWFEYDRNNQLVKETRPEGQQTTYDYNDAGNLIEKIDAKDQKTAYEYDEAGRLVQIQYYAASDDAAPVKTVEFAYDRAGNLTGYDDGTTSAVYTYDNLYRKLSETVNYGAFELTNAYTSYNNGLKKTFTGPDGVTYAYTYDDNNQLTGVNIPGAGYITYSAYQWNRPTEVILPGGSKREYAYDPLMRVKSITAKDPAENVLLDYQYNYDRMDNITAKATEHGEYGYGYDDLYRLTDADNPVQADEGFSYDAVGNRLTAAGVTGNWGYNDNNELQGYADLIFEYDANGNMTQKTDTGQVTNYIYNVEDRLQEIRDGSGSLISQYYYDPFGRRLWKDVGGVKTYFVYADEGLVAEVDAAGNVVKSYGYRPGSAWTTDPLFMKVDEQYYFYQNDHLGTPQKLTAVNGAVVWSVKYSSFGKADIDISSTITNSLRFPGQYYEEETELNCNYFRFYDSKVGRYLRTDPLGIRGGNNTYVYVRNNPIKLFDMLGLIDSSEPNLESLREELRRQAEREYQYINYINQQRNSELVYPESGYGGWEIHVIGGIGGLSSYCCDGDKKLRHNYIKFCYGAAFDASISMGGEFDFPNQNKGTCSKPAKKMIGPEFGATVFGVFGGEGAATIDTESGSAVGSYGGGVGIPIPYRACA